MSAAIPFSGEHSFAIQAQNMVELNRLLSTKATAAVLALNVGGQPVSFFGATVLEILPLSPVQGVDLIAVKLNYSGRVLQPASFLPPANDAQQTQSIMAQIQSAAAGRQQERWAIMQQLQTQIFQVTQDITVNKAKTADKAFSAMEGYIRN